MELENDNNREEMITQGRLPKKEFKKMKKGRLFIRNLPFKVSKEDISELFSNSFKEKGIGKIYDIVFPGKGNRTESNINKGCCFVQLSSKKEALQAIKVII